MCGGVAYLNGSEVVRTYFPNPQARLPVLRRDGVVELVRWGRRESDKECLTLPRGGWARLDSLRAGKWDRWFPKPIRIPALSYMEKDPRGCSNWFDLSGLDALQGVLVMEPGEDIRVYVVTMDGDRSVSIHGRQPRVVPR
jgi:hypothetical protein